MAGKHVVIVEMASNIPILFPRPVYPGGRLDKSWTEGRQAYVFDELQTANPHSAGSADYEAWDQGWVVALAANSASQTAMNNSQVQTCNGSAAFIAGPP
jgi:hypothetical protein